MGVERPGSSESGAEVWFACGMDGLPETRYAWSDDLSIAYQTVGEGDPHLVMVPGMISHVEALHEISG